MHAPKLTSLACCSCEHVRLYPKEVPPVSVNFVNASIGTKSLKHLAKHPRVGLENMHGSNGHDHTGGMLADYPPPNMAGMVGRAMAELFGNIMGGPGGVGGHSDDSDEETRESDGGAAPDLNDAYMVHVFAMLQQAGHGGMPGQSILYLLWYAGVCMCNIQTPRTYNAYKLPLLFSYIQTFSLASLQLMADFKADLNWPTNIFQFGLVRCLGLELFAGHSAYTYHVEEEDEEDDNEEDEDEEWNEVEEEEEAPEKIQDEQRF